MGLSKERKLARKAFLLFWGGWTVAAFVIGAFLPEMPLRSEQAVLIFGTVIIVGLAMARFELAYRRERLPREARRPWHSKLVIVPLALVAWVPHHTGTIVHRVLIDGFYVSQASSHGSTMPIHWGFLMAGVFSLLLLPLTWFVVRFTMFPKGIPLREDR